MATPKINTAIPKRRYQYGEFTITVLGDIDSGDGTDYRWICAVATEADPTPGLFISAERTDEISGACCRMRVSMADGSQLLGESDRYADLDPFVDEALDVAARILGLGDEVPLRLS